jgi:hypothetical protein
MHSWTDEQHARWIEARRLLRTWDAECTAPALLVRGVSALHSGSPSAIYTIADRGSGSDAVAALEGLTSARLRGTPFMQENLLFSRMFTTARDDDSPFGVENQAIMGEDLERDPLRWQVFGASLLRPLGLSDHLRIMFTDANGAWLGLCGSFTTRGRRFTDGDRALMTAFTDEMLDVLLAWHELAPAFVPRHPMFQTALAWPWPAFAYTTTEKFMFANRAARLALTAAPGWLPEALRTDAAVPREWSCGAITYANGRIKIFQQRAGDAGRCWFDQALVGGMELSPHLARIAPLAVQGLTNPQIAELTGMTVRTVAKYVERLRLAAGVATRTELTYKLAARRSPITRRGR